MRVAQENPTWGYTRLRGALKNLGHELGRNTIKRLLADHGIAPAPERGKSMSWSTFLKAHWGAIAATDLFTVEVEIVSVLARDPNASVRLVVEISADFPEGASESMKRAVSENARSLGITKAAWE